VSEQPPAGPLLPNQNTWHAFDRFGVVLGHRGARHAAPENTLRAFELARLEGAAGTELDVQTSRDGKLHVVHDLTLTRVTSGRNRQSVHALTRAELDGVVLDGGEPIPQLEQVLAWAEQHDMLLNVELKSKSSRRDSVAAACAELLAGNHWAETHVCVSSFHPRLLKQFHALAPRIRSAFLVSNKHLAWCAPLFLRFLGVSAVHPQFNLLLNSPTLREHLGYFQVNTWTVNDPAHARALRDQGVFALISDNPGKLIQGLASVAS